MSAGGKSRRALQRGGAAAAAALAAAMVLAAGPALPLAPGDILGADNWEEARDLLPPEILRFYREGKYRNKVAEWPRGLYHKDDAFIAATKANRGRYTVDARGTIIERATGKQPARVEGLPFPDIDPKDPQAGVKILWNHYYDYWAEGNYHNQTRLVWLSRKGVDRTATQDVYFLYYEAQLRKYSPPRNPNNLFWQFLARSVAPADLQGMASLGWRYRDSDKRDALWTYVPAMRRVRQVSPANRSDGFLGSDMSQDDGPFFDGKPEDFTWKLVGTKEMLRYMDPISLHPEQSPQRRLPGGGWTADWPEIPVVGFEDPKWEGVPWAPVAPVLARRRLWVVEGVPKDRYYLYGRIQLYIDHDDYQGAWNRKFDWKGELNSIYQVIGAPATRPAKGAPGEWLWVSGMNYRCVYNVKMDRATYPEVHAGKWPSERRIPLDPSFFDPVRLVRVGK